MLRQPVGAFYDTAHHGLEAIEEVLQGNIHPFYPHYSGHQPMQDWVLAIVFLFIGVGTTSLHIPGLIASALTVWLVCVVGTTLWSQRAGLYTALIVATSHWWLLLTQESLRIVLVPPLLLIWIWMFARILQAPRDKWWLVRGVIGGLALGALMYSYSSAWIIMPFLLLTPVCSAGYFLMQKHVHRRAVLACFAMLIAFTATAWPVFQYAHDNPNHVTQRATSQIDTDNILALAKHTISGLPQATLGFISIPFLIYPSEFGGTTTHFLGAPFSFPIPLLAFGFSVLLLIAFWLLFTVHPKNNVTLILLFLLFFLGTIPSLLTVGEQPHVRRIIVSFPPLMLVLGYATVFLEKKIHKHTWPKFMFYVLLVLSFTYGPAVYIKDVVSSDWYGGFYQLRWNTIARRTFARIEDGQRVAVVANGAHIKSMQFYALASSTGRDSFYFIPLEVDKDFSETDQIALEGIDAVIAAYDKCETMSIPGFSIEPSIITERSRTVGCIFDRDQISEDLRTRQVALPSSGPLFSAFLTKTSPLQPHRPFYGRIYDKKF